MIRPFCIRSEARFLIADFAEPQRILSWCINKPGFCTASQLAWMEVSDVDLPLGRKPEELIVERLEAVELQDVPVLVTSRSLSRYHLAQASAGDQVATCLATVGLSNGERIGQRLPGRAPFGTINILLHVATCLSEAALVELISLASSARTVAVLDSGIRRDGVAITGTGTDCIVVAAPIEGRPEQFAGMHTELGEAAGAAVYRAIFEGAEAWRADFEAMLRKKEAAE
jgi:adenosylcobinamide amidohydrolase